MDFIERLCEEIDKMGFYSEVSVPMLTEGNSIALVVMPSNDYDHYFDGSYRQTFQFQLLARHSEQLTAYYTLVNMTSTLDAMPEGHIVSQDSSFEFEKFTIVTDTNGIGVDEQGYIYVAQMSASLFVSAK